MPATRPASPPFFCLPPILQRLAWNPGPLEKNQKTQPNERTQSNSTQSWTDGKGVGQQYYVVRAGRWKSCSPRRFTSIAVLAVTQRPCAIVSICIHFCENDRHGIGSRPRQTGLHEHHPTTPATAHVAPGPSPAVGAVRGRAVVLRAGTGR